MVATPPLYGLCSTLVRKLKKVKEQRVVVRFEVNEKDTDLAERYFLCAIYDNGDTEMVSYKPFREEQLHEEMEKFVNAKEMEKNEGK